MNSSIRGVYIVSEEACLIPGSGAYKHINAGFVQLSRHYDIDMVQFCKSPILNNTIGQKEKKSVRSSEIKRVIKWFYILIKNHINFFRYLISVKKIKPDFIYERSSYLNFNGLIISKLLKVPHVYEVNGVLAYDNQEYFPSILNKISFLAEKKMYQSTFGFYIGGINEVFKIKNGGFKIIQNGIEEDYVKRFENRINKVEGKIVIAFVGHAMAHHRLDILIKALNLLIKPELFKVYLIGTNLESVKNEINSNVEVVYYGSLTHDQIAEVMHNVNVGVITYALPYSSHVKAFMYGGSKLLMLVPDVQNFKSIFSELEVMFINNCDPEDLSNKLNNLVDNQSMLNDLGCKVYSKITNFFTWEKIYEEIAETIRLRLAASNQ